MIRERPTPSVRAQRVKGKTKGDVIKWYMANDAKRPAQRAPRQLPSLFAVTAQGGQSPHSASSKGLAVHVQAVGRLVVHRDVITNRDELRRALRAAEPKVS